MFNLFFFCSSLDVKLRRLLVCVKRKVIKLQGGMEKIVLL